jgi:4-amino-4-deoxy-L-arabinose transferase-like glycosyltransferase
VAVFGDGDWLGRLLSLSYVAILAVAVWLLARRLTSDPLGRAARTRCGTSPPRGRRSPF